MDEEINELMQKALNEVKVARREIEQQKQNNLQITQKLATYADIFKGNGSETIQEASERLNAIEDRIQKVFDNISLIEEAYYEHHRALIVHHGSLKKMEADQEMSLRKIEQKYFSELNEMAPLLLQRALNDLIEKKQHNIFQKIKTMESTFDGRIHKILNAEEAVKAQKKNIYLGVGTIVAIGVIAMNFLR